MKLLDLLHPRDHRNSEGAPLLAASTSNAVLCPGAESLFAQGISILISRKECALAVFFPEQL